MSPGGPTKRLELVDLRFGVLGRDRLRWGVDIDSPVDVAHCVVRELSLCKCSRSPGARDFSSWAGDGSSTGGDSKVALTLERLLGNARIPLGRRRGRTSVE